MTYCLRIALIAATILASAAPCALARGFGRRVRGGPVEYSVQSGSRPGWHSSVHVAPHPGHRRAPSYDEYYRYMNSYYPKYYGGFHSSYFQNMGVPSGDVGLRGNGIFMSPW